ncbi:MAG TPA: hypothetical protein VGK00_15885 [Anaerolineales bacterium]|jgi:hypothetical protein
MRRQSAFRTGASRSAFDQAVEAARETFDGFLNQVFALTHHTALRRSMVVGVSFILIWLGLAFTAHPFAEYKIMVNLLAEKALSGDAQAFVIQIVGVLFSTFFYGPVVRHLLALYVPFWLMQRIAATYLADIFEKDESVALKFINQAAFAGSYNTIRIRQGKVVEEDMDSPMIQIGGPGYVVVELDSAIVLEKPDGSARVIGPTSRATHTEKFVTGFERLRQGIDLRDVIEKQDITTRTRDGIPVTAKDIQYSFSLYRGATPVRSPQTPYPYDEAAVLNLVYGNVRPVKPGENPVLKHDWVEPLPGKIFGQISGEIGGFINRRGLSDFLSAVGKPEDDDLQERKRESDERIRVISGLDDSRLEQTTQGDETVGRPAAPAEAPAAPASEFVPRSLLTKMLYDNFQARAEQRGTHINWIGVGTWDTPAQIIPKNHREAWKISRENLKRGNSTELQHIYDDARLQEMIRLIEEVSIRFVYNEQSSPAGDEQVMIINVLKEHLGVLKRARDLYRRENIPVEILIAIQEIERWLFPPSYAVGDE